MRPNGRPADAFGCRPVDASQLASTLALAAACYVFLADQFGSPMSLVRQLEMRRCPP